MEKYIQLDVSILIVFIITAILLLAYFSLWGLVAIIRKRADLADLAWGLGFFLVSWVSFFLSPFSLKTLIVNLLVTIWAFRLAIHIYLRNRTREEDFRYQSLKEKWGKNVSWNLFIQVFLLQGLILYIIGLPIIWLNTHPNHIPFSRIWFALPFWLFGFLIEAIGDYQLLKFKENLANKGKLMKEGLWKFVRHPNYLGEIIQWWTIWGLTLFIPFIISPILITFLLIKVSGIAPIEKKMKTHPEFAEYAEKTPALFPFRLINGALYTFAWFVIIHYGARDSFWIPFSVFVLIYGIQIYLFIKNDRNNLFVSIPLSIYALILGLLQETLFANFYLLKYPGTGFFPPFWLISLYPLFSLTINTSLSFLNKKLLLSFFIGGLGAVLSYLSGEKLGAVIFLTPLAYLFTFLFWGVLLVVIILLNRRLIALKDRYTNREEISKPLTVFFDSHCPVCSREMEALKKREQTGAIIYACPESDEELKKITDKFTYLEAMEKIHAIKSSGEVLTGTEVLSELYARTNLPLLAIVLQAPLFREVGILCYAIWAKLRKKI